ncbi:MAG TPA: carboxypeptidase regulatory-like domain-containing protein, partial [Gammaproteobacteria bacterium]|nr:carboxypeptidase regulatory-like domain-containing protein [Gammaproteobacteria bacterium]
MRLSQFVWISAFLTACFAATVSAATLPPAATAAIGWLQTQVNADGSLASESQSIASPLQARSEAATAIGLASTIPASLTGAVTADTGTDTESLARRVIALVQSGQSTTAAVQLLYGNQNADGGFGSQPGDSSDALDTAFALLALRAANDTSATNLSNALLYLVGNVDSDGGYGLPAGGSGSQVYVTAYVLLAYQAYATSYPLTTQIGGARQWLIGQQSGGIYADTLSDALASLALASSSNDSAAYSGALAALSAGQQADGSWGDDPYLTAIAARALAGSTAQQSATTGSMSGVVLDAASHAPIAGAQIQLSGPASVSGTSSGNGSLSIGNLIPGAYAVSVTAAGYSGVTLQNIQVNAAATTTVGTLLLSAVPNLAAISGTLTDANGTPVAGAVISVSGADAASATSASNGSYSISSLTPGAVTLTVSAAGYDTITVPASLAGGLVLNFSPALYPTGTTPSGADLTGSVQDAQSGMPIAGATVTVGSSTVQTDSTGRFSLAGLTAGTYTATVSASGYSGATLSGSLADGNNNAGLVLLSLVAPANDMSAVSGTVTDSSTGKPIAGVSVQVQSTTIATITDTNGNYQLTGIPGAQFAVLFAAPGYLSKDSGVGLAAPGALVLNAALVPAGSSNLLVKNLTLDHASYNPYTEAVISTEIDNTGSQDQAVILDAQIVDALGDVVQDIPAIALNLATPPSAALQTVPAGGSLGQDFTFYVRNTLAGTYRVVIQATDSSGNVVAEGGTALTVDPLAQIGGGLTLNPPITQANANQPIHVTGTVSNLGNLPVDAGMLQLSVSVGDNASATAAPTPPIALSTFYAEGDYTGPVGGAKDAQGNMYVVDTYFGGPTFKVHKIAPDGSSTLLATIPGSVTINGIRYGLNDGARSVQPSDLAVDPSGNVWVLNSHNFIVKITPAGSLSYVDTGIPTLRYIECDPSGNLYFTGANGTNNLLTEMSPSGQLTTLVQNGISKPGYITATPSGNLYVTNFGDNTVSQVAPGGVISTFATGLNGPQGIASDASGNLYVANSGANEIVEISPTGVPQVFATGFNNPAGLAFDSQGVLYVTNTGDNSISKVTPEGQVTTFAQSAASNPQGLSYDAQGDLYIANAGNDSVTEIDQSGKVRVVATGLSNPKQPVVDAAGNILVTNYGSGSVTETANGTTTTLASGFNQPYGVALDTSGNAYVTEYGANSIDEIPAGNGTPQSIAVSLLRLPGTLSLAPDGSLIVSNYYAGISRIPLGGGGQVISTIGGQAGPTSFDSSGTLYFTQGTILYKIVGGANVNVATIPSTEA